jgi:hypothetical protein
MRPIRDGWTIVLAGAWNPRIFTPDWLATNVFNLANISLEFPIQPLAPYRFHGNNVTIVPSQDRVVLAPENLRDETLVEMEHQAIRILELLPHTPLSAVGTNYRFMEDELVDPLRRVFGVADEGDLAAAGYGVSETQVSRKLTWDGGSVTFRLTRVAAGVTADFNFHRPLTAAATAVDQLRDAVLRDRNRAADILQSIYAVVPELQEAR